MPYLISSRAETKNLPSREKFQLTDQQWEDVIKIYEATVNYHAELIAGNLSEGVVASSLDNALEHIANEMRQASCGIPEYSLPTTTQDYKVVVGKITRKGDVSTDYELLDNKFQVPDITLASEYTIPFRIQVHGVTIEIATTLFVYTSTVVLI